MPSTLPNALTWWSQISQTWVVARRNRLGSGFPSFTICSWSSVQSSPASIRRARSTSCGALRSGTLPISFRYIRTGSLVGALSASTSMRICVTASVSSPGSSMISMPSVFR